MNNDKTKKIALLGLMASMTLVLSYIEFLLPPIYSGVPGIKMGLPNIVVIFTLYKMGSKEAGTVSFIRLISVWLLFGSAMTFVYSLAGAALSLVVMAVLKRLDVFSNVAVSVAGAISHNAGQITVAVFLLERAEIGYYMTVLAFTGAIAGLLIGLVSAYLLKLLKGIKF